MFFSFGQVNHRPPEDVPSGWVPREELIPVGEPLEGSVDADVLVLGAGFTGLAAARRIAELEPHSRVLLVDAKPVGWGASGRNSGFVIDLPHKFELASRDADRLAAILRLNRQAIADLEALVAREGIACDWSRAGKLQGAVRERGTGLMQGFMDALDLIGEPYEELDRDACHAVTGTRHYAGAVFTPGSILMNPVALVQGLARSLPANVTLADCAPVVRFARKGDRFVARTRSDSHAARITADRVLLCANAFAPEFGYLRNRVIPVMTFASITRPLDAEERARYAGRFDWGLTPADPAGTTLRMTADGRLLIRNQYDVATTYGADPVQLDSARSAHRHALAERYPDLIDLPFTATWGGVCGLTRNHASWFGELGPGIWGSLCHNGVGVARGTISGRLVAEQASDRHTALLEDMVGLSNQPSLVPPDPFLSLGVRARLKYEAWRSAEEI